MSQDDQRRALERQAGQGDDAALARLQALNDRAGLGPDDASYLLQYLRIADDFCGRGSMGQGGSISYGDARRRLAALNDEYKTRVGTRTLRAGFPAEGIALGGYRGSGGQEDRCWMPSDICMPANVDDQVGYGP